MHQKKFLNRIPNAIAIYIGVISRLTHVEWLRRAHILKPTLFRNSVIEAIRPRPELDEYDYCSDLSVWDTRDRPEPEEAVVFEIYGHIDGVKIFENSENGSIKPILNKLSAVRCGETRLCLPSEMPVFLTGIYRGKKEGFYNFTKQYSDELRTMKPNNGTDRDFYCELVCMICDQPQRAECKGITNFNGNNGCERCIQKGEHLGGKMIFSDTNAPLRLDQEWESYLNDPFWNEVREYATMYMKNTAYRFGRFY